MRKGHREKGVITNILGIVAMSLDFRHMYLVRIGLNLAEHTQISSQRNQVSMKENICIEVRFKQGIGGTCL